MAILWGRFTIREGRGMEEQLTGGWGQQCAVVVAFFLNMRDTTASLSWGIIHQRRERPHTHE